MHTDNQALPRPILAIDFIPYEPGVMSSYRDIRPTECTVNGASLCLEDAVTRWGVHISKVGYLSRPGEALLSRRRALRPCLRRTGPGARGSRSSGLSLLSRMPVSFAFGSVFSSQLPSHRARPAIPAYINRPVPSNMV